MYTNLGARYRLSVHEHMRTQRNPSHALAKREFAEPCVPTCHGRDPFPFSRTSWLGVWKRGDGECLYRRKTRKDHLPIFRQVVFFYAAKDRPGRFVARGCVSKADLDILGLPVPAGITSTPQNRTGCHCLSIKGELLDHRAPCPNKCIYCYWKGTR